MTFRASLTASASALPLHMVAVPPDMLAANMADAAYRRYCLAANAEKLRSLTEQAEALANDGPECEACDAAGDGEYCEGCGCCSECCNCSETDCDCSACIDRLSDESAYANG